MRWRWSAFLAEKVSTVMWGQSGRRSRSSRARLVMKRRTSLAGSGLRAEGLDEDDAEGRAKGMAEACESGGAMAAGGRCLGLL
jgi:hypothetical protein